MRPSNQLVFSAIPATGTDVTNSAAIECQQLLAFSVQSVSTGTNTGTLKVQISNDPKTNLATNNVPVNWTDLPSATISVTAASTLAIVKTEICYEWIRLVYTNATGTGTVSARVKFLGL